MIVLEGKGEIKIFPMFVYSRQENNQSNPESRKFGPFVLTGFYQALIEPVTKQRQIRSRLLKLSTARGSRTLV